MRCHGLEESRARTAEDHPQVLTELWELLLAYGKQETVEPLKGWAASSGFGLAAAVVGATGILMLTLGTMRVLQTHTGGT